MLKVEQRIQGGKGGRHLGSALGSGAGPLNDNTALNSIRLYCAYFENDEEAGYEIYNT